MAHIIRIKILYGLRKKLNIKRKIYCYFTNTWKSEVTSQKTECVNFKKTCSLHKLKYKMYAAYKTFLLWESEVGKISSFFETFFWR